MKKEELLKKAHELIESNKVNEIIPILKSLPLDRSDRGSIALWIRQYTELKNERLSGSYSKDYITQKENALAENLLGHIDNITLNNPEAPGEKPEMQKQEAPSPPESKIRAGAKSAVLKPINQEEEQEKNTIAWYIWAPILGVILAFGGWFFLSNSINGGTIPEKPALIDTGTLQEKLNQLARDEDNLTLQKEMEAMVPSGTKVARFREGDKDNSVNLSFESYLGSLNLEIISASIIINEFSENQGQYVLKVTHYPK